MSTYFSAFKWVWLLDNVEAVQQAKQEGRCMLGTMDSWLIYNLTGATKGTGCATVCIAVYCTVASNLMVISFPECVPGSGMSNMSNNGAFIPYS